MKNIEPKTLKVGAFPTSQALYAVGLEIMGPHRTAAILTA